MTNDIHYTTAERQGLEIIYLSEAICFLVCKPWTNELAKSTEVRVMHSSNPAERLFSHSF